ATGLFIVLRAEEEPRRRGDDQRQEIMFREEIHMKRARSSAVPLARSLVASFAVLAFVAPAAMAASMSGQTTGDERNILRGVVYYSYPTGEQRIPVNIETDNGVELFRNAKFEEQDAPGCPVSYD